MDQLYQAALAEGGNLIVYAGGDAVGQQDFTKVAFEKLFPGLKMEMIVDFSKYHDGRIDYQLANKSIIPDLAQLQTLHDFPKWRQQGVLLEYKPVGWDKIYGPFKDEGYYYPITIIAFSNIFNKNALPTQAQRPLEANDYLKPEFKGKIVATYPNDDDAVLYWFKQIVDKYGWEWVHKFMAQNVTFVRGTQASNDLVRSGQFPVSFTAGESLTDVADDPVGFALPKKDPFVMWAQTAAIFKDAQHPAAAKLYMNWALEKEQQATGYTWSVRRDVPPPNGYKNPFDYKSQTKMMAFFKFMMDRQAVESFKTQITLIVGEVEGPSPTRSIELGITPTKAIPHTITA